MKAWLGGPCRGSSKKAFGRPGKAEKAKRYPACSPEEKHLQLQQCPSVATSGLLLCPLARMRNPTLKKKWRGYKIMQWGLFVQNHQGHLDAPVKKADLFRLTLVHRCVHGHALAYLAECYETNKQYGHCITRGVNKLHFKSVNTEFGRRATKGAQDWNKLPAILRNVQCIKTFRTISKTQYVCSISIWVYLHLFSFCYFLFRHCINLIHFLLCLFSFLSCLCCMYIPDSLVDQPLAEGTFPVWN